MNLLKKIFTSKQKINSDNSKERESIINSWKMQGKPIPPPHFVKQDTIEEYRKKYSFNIFIESGTYLGDMVESQKNKFNQCFSIELGEELYKNAKSRFQKDKNVTIFFGDSGNVLPDILKLVNEPVIFWLDGHYSSGITALGDKECPVIEEIQAIIESKISNCVILIDDARLFNGSNDYPTIEEINNIFDRNNINYSVENKDDIIRYVL